MRHRPRGGDRNRLRFESPAPFLCCRQTRVMARIGCCPWEQRESSNYIEERYYCCFVLGLRATASIADDSEFPDYQFRLHLDPEFLRSSTAFLAELADCVARKLVVKGDEVLRPFDSITSIRLQGRCLGSKLSHKWSVVIRRALHSILELL